MIIHFSIILAVMLAAFESLAGFPVPPATGPNDAMPRAAFHYPAFTIPLADGYYTEVELKATETNFEPTAVKVTIGGAAPLFAVATGTRNARPVYEFGSYGDFKNCIISYISDLDWNFEYYENSEQVIHETLSGSLGEYPPDVTVGEVVTEVVYQYCYYYDTFRPSLNYYNGLPAAELNGHCYYSVAESDNPRKSHLLAATENLSDVAGPANLVKYVTIYPSRSTGQGYVPSDWMHPYNPDLTWIFSRRHPINGPETDELGNVQWHRIEPTAWLPFQK